MDALLETYILYDYLCIFKDSDKIKHVHLHKTAPNPLPVPTPQQQIKTQ
jgi:hypothetical protein